MKCVQESSRQDFFELTCVEYWSLVAMSMIALKTEPSQFHKDGERHGKHRRGNSVVVPNTAVKSQVREIPLR